MLVTAIFLIIGLHHNYDCPAVSAAYFGYFQFQNHLLTPQFWVSNVNSSLLMLAPPTESFPLPRKALGYTMGMDAPP